MTAYPGAIPSLPRPGGGTTMDTPGFTGSGVIDGISDEVEAIATELGVDPSGSFTTVAARLGAIDTGIPDVSAIYIPPTALTTRPRTMVTAFQSGHGFTLNSGASANLNDTSTYCLGTQSASFTSSGNGAAATLRSITTGPHDLTGRDIGVWVKVSDLTHFSQLYVYAFSGSTANFYNWVVEKVDTNSWLPVNGWAFVTLSLSDASTTGSPTLSNITGWQFYSKDDGTAPITVYVNGICTMLTKTAYPQGVVSFSFDDCFQSVYDLARPILDVAGFPATEYVIVDEIGQSGRVTLAELQTMQNLGGWEIAVHANTVAAHNARLTTLTAAEVDADMIAARAYLVANGLSRGSAHMAYPGGQWNDSVLNSMRKLFLSARTIEAHSHETLPPADRHRLRAVSSVSSLGVTTTQVQTLVDNAYAAGGWLILAFHQIVSGAATATTECSVADFQTIVSYVASKGIPVRTVGDVMLTAATDTASPLIPNRFRAAQTFASPVVLADQSAPAAVAGSTVLASVGSVATVTDPNGVVTKLVRPATGQPVDHGVIAWSYDPANATNTSIVSPAGQLQLVKINIPSPTTVSNVLLYVTTAGSGLTAGQCFAGLYNSAGTLLATTADQATAWASTGLKSMALISPPVVAAGDYYLGFFYNGTTAPTLARGGGSGVVNLNIGSSTSRFGNGSSGNTTAMPSVTGSIGATSIAWWAGLS